VAAVKDRRTQAAMLVAVGGMAVFLGRSDLTLSYVRAGIRPLLLASGAVLVALGLAALRDTGTAGPPARTLPAGPPAPTTTTAPTATAAPASPGCWHCRCWC